MTVSDSIILTLILTYNRMTGNRQYQNLSQILPILGRGSYSHVCERHLIINKVVHIRGDSHHLWVFFLS